MYGYIYKTTDLSNNKIYIGQHHASKFEGYSYVGSGYFISRIKKQCLKKGVPLEERLSIEMIDTADSKEELSYKEIYYIKKFNAQDKEVGYNLTEGGEGGDTVGGRFKITDGQHEMLWYPNVEIPEGWQIGTLSYGEHNWNFGKKFYWVTDGQIELRLEQFDDIPSGFKLGRLPMKPEQKMKISKNHNTFRNNFSAETLEKYKQNFSGDQNPQRKNPKVGDKNPFYGKHHTKESIEKNRLAHQIRYKCPFCDYVSNKSCVTRHINKCHSDIIESASTIESKDYEKYII